MVILTLLLRRFLANRAKLPEEGYRMGFDKEDVSNLPIVMQNLLKLQCGSVPNAKLAFIQRLN